MLSDRQLNSTQHQLATFKQNSSPVDSRHTSCSRSVIFRVLHFTVIENFLVIFWSCKFSAPIDFCGKQQSNALPVKRPAAGQMPHLLIHPVKSPLGHMPPVVKRPFLVSEKDVARHVINMTCYCTDNINQTKGQ